MCRKEAEGGGDERGLTNWRDQSQMGWGGGEMRTGAEIWDTKVKVALEDGTDRQSPNVGNQIPIRTA